MKNVAKLTILLLTTAVAMPAWAQDTAAEPNGDEEIVVTGMRESMRTSVARKKNTMEIVESITAEDIGKLPDPNVAETLSRIPGVQAYRYGGEGASPVGEGSGITIRGLTGQTASRIDGRAYFTAGGREFNVEGAIPGMIAGIDVYKNPSAQHIEGGIGGLINVRSRMPLDFDGLTVSAAVSARYNDLSEEISPEVFGLIANRWQVGDGEMGFMIAGSYQESDNRSDSNPASRGPQTRRAIRADNPVYATTAGANQAYVGRSDVWHLANVTCPGGGTYEANPGQVWEETEFWVDLSWEIDPDGSLGIRQYFESPYRPGERITMDEYFGWMFENSVPGLPEAAAKEGLTPLAYMRRNGAFEIRAGAEAEFERPLSPDEVAAATLDEKTGILNTNVPASGSSTNSRHTGPLLIRANPIPRPATMPPIQRFPRHNTSVTP